MTQVSKLLTQKEGGGYPPCQQTLRPSSGVNGLGSSASPKILEKKKTSEILSQEVWGPDFDFCGGRRANEKSIVALKGPAQ